jgi:hypothetical protein
MTFYEPINIQLELKNHTTIYYSEQANCILAYKRFCFFSAMDSGDCRNALGGKLLL